jgi:hypothetical protein
MNLDELERLALDSMSQSWVSVEIDDLLKLIAVVRAAAHATKVANVTVTGHLMMEPRHFDMILEALAALDDI